MVNKTLEKYLGNNPNRSMGDDFEDSVNAINQLDLGIEGIAKKKLFVELARKYYPEIDPSFLRLKHSNSHLKTIFYDANKGKIEFNWCTPQFAIYSLDSSKCEMNIGLSYSDEEKGLHISKFNIFPNVPEFIKIHFRKAIKPKCYYICGSPYSSEREYKFTSIFNGIIPETTRTKIKDSKAIFSGNLYLIAEANNWSCEEVPIKDPLVIGIKDSICFLIDDFNTTSMEWFAKENLLRD